MPSFRISFRLIPSVNEFKINQNHRTDLVAWKCPKTVSPDLQAWYFLRVAAQPHFPTRWLDWSRFAPAVLMRRVHLVTVRFSFLFFFPNI